MHTLVRSTLLAGMTGTLMVSAAWAGLGIAPVPVPEPLPGAPSAQSAGSAGSAAAAGDTSASTASTAVNPVALGAGQLLVGAAKTSMNPDPDAMQDRFPGARWETDPATCKTLEPAWLQSIPASTLNAMDGVANPGSVWPENPSCIYMGGFGLGPMNPVERFDQVGDELKVTDAARAKEVGFGLWVRSMAFSDGTQTLITTVIDGEGWLWDYEKKCKDCGAKQINAALAADPELAARGVTAASHILHATHSHASPDFIGGWGFVPNWYMAQITEAIKSTAKQAVMSMEAATLEAGEQEARAHNSERRTTYRAAEEAQISWLRAVAVEQDAPEPAAATADTSDASPAAAAPGRSGEAPGKPNGVSVTAESPSPSPAPLEPSSTQPRVIATLGAFAAHPVTFGTNNRVAHPDWLGLFNRRVEERFGGIALHFMTGLGNLTGANRLTGGALADLIPAVGQGRPVDDTTVKVGAGTATSALTNVPLTTLGTPGLFDRKFSPTPAVVRTGERDTAPCLSASPQSVELPYSAARIGNDIVLTAAPGEVFANYTNTVEEKNAGRITFALAQANDALGYMPQSFEINPVGQQALGFVAGGYVFVNYEDSYAIDRCTGDLMLEETLKLMATVKQ